MSRSLRSCSRQKKLQVQHIQQVNKKLRVNINNCIETNTDNFNQMEFLSLFGLTQIVQLNGNRNRRTKRADSTRMRFIGTNEAALKRKFSVADATDTVFNNNNDARKVHQELECGLTNEQQLQKLVLAKRQSLLHKLHDAVADQRKVDLLFEQEKQKNIILRISMNELLSKMLFLCEKKKCDSE